MTPRLHRMVVFIAVSFATAFLLASGAAPGRAQQAPVDLRLLHQAAVHATVRVVTSTGHGSGWILAQNSGRPVVITNAHVARSARRGRVRLEYYRGASEARQVDEAEVLWTSRNIDLAIIRLGVDPPASARALELEPGDIVRGERIVLAGNPRDLPFQTTEGVVTGAIAADDRYAEECGSARNCVVVDAASFGGSSGGPAINANGRLVGMLWGGPEADVRIAGTAIPAWVQNPSFA